MENLFKQATRFASVGAISTGVHVMAALLLNSWLGFAPLLANFGAFLIATTWSFIGNWAWTFEAKTKVKFAAPRFLALASSGFFLNQLIVYVVTQSFGLPLWAAMLPVVAVVPPFTFWISRAHVFKEPVLR